VVLSPAIGLGCKDGFDLGSSIAVVFLVSDSVADVICKRLDTHKQLGRVTSSFRYILFHASR
jgi:hypothetical protein